MDGSFRLDEGYSEDTRSLDDADSTMGIEPRPSSDIGQIPSPLLALQNAVMALNEAQRSEHAYQVLRTLRTSSIAAIVDMLTPLLHIDPVLTLPPEITAQVFAYLSPPMLLEASSVSKSWRARIFDSRLWRNKFRSEGWMLNTEEIARYEQNYEPAVGLRKTRSRKAESHSEQRMQKRRQRHQQQHRSQDSNVPIDHAGMIEEIEAFRQRRSSLQDEEMQDADQQIQGNGSSGHPATFDRMDTQSSSRSNELESPNNPSQPEPDYLAREPLVYATSATTFRLNYQQVYKQKRKLEENWATGRYKSFQLPHRDHPDEAHSECVYTIQHSGKYLVSGSRDKTLRIWNLDTQRLVRRPLDGHSGSVLCLQFDASPEEDLIVSGSSDNDVILWQFSTGKMLKRISKAHKDSVLNLKFDRRFLVTCSKDKMIKVWNRQELRPGDLNYPKRGLEGGGKFPSYILDMHSIPKPSQMENNLTAKQMEPIQPYSLIMGLDGHSAAVNAVHIYKDNLVSASGDRYLKVFDIHSGVCTSVCKGHNKGIACVQYDGKRVVSGSSDNTIRIFDPISRAEIACLEGHSKLVRTIQASFCDIPGSEAELEQEARDADRAYFEATRTGAIPTSSVRPERIRERNAGSRRPEHMMAIGAKIPPGGGGGPWARIVSGSYDETVIIWRQASDGNWEIAHRLRQAEALRAAGEPLVARSEHITRYNLQQQQLRAAQGQQQHHHHHQQQVAGQPDQTQTPGIFGLPGPQAIIQQTAQTALNAALTAMNPTLGGAQATAAVAVSQATTPAAQPAVPAWFGNQTQPPTPAVGLQAPPAVPPLNTAMVQPPPILQQQQQQPPANQLPHHLNGMHLHHPSQPNARVFKLQFDARRIICCSQDPKIVGWDFANGDEEIIECARFFGSPT